MSTTERLFISFEGPDGSGKTTQLRLLAKRLREQGVTVVESAEPGGTRIAQQIRAILLDPANEEMSAAAELLLYFAARAQNVAQVIRPALARGEVVLSDRFTDSTLAYQGAGRKLGRDVVLQLHDIVCSGLQPDLTICLDLPISDALRRVINRTGVDRLDAEAVEFHERVRQEYLRLAAAEPDRIVVVDASGAIEDVAERIWEAVCR